MKKITVLLVYLLFAFLWDSITADCSAKQDLREEYRRNLEEFRKKAKNDLDDFRAKAIAQYVEAMRNPWKNIKVEPIIEKPVDPEPGPIVIDEDKIDRDLEGNPIKGQEIPIGTVVSPITPEPRPAPVKPIEPLVKPSIPKMSFNFFGSTEFVSEGSLRSFRLKSIEDSDVADGLNVLANVDNDAFISDCLEARKRLALPDWGFFMYVDKALENFSPSGSSKHTLMMGYVLMQCGYRLRFLKGDSNLLLYLSSNEALFDRHYITIDGLRYWEYHKSNVSQVTCCDVKFPGERGFSLSIPVSPDLPYASGNQRKVNVKGYPNLTLQATSNKNLIDFFNSYPNGSMDGSPLGRWLVNAGTPMSNELKNDIYPILRESIKGMNQNSAANLLIKVAQSFDYGLDDEIWGEDRSFWPEESWHYPLSDCEDHAIHFTRLVKDILGLKTALVYYPGHLAAAVIFTDGSERGDYVISNGEKYTLCDPTYFYASVGEIPSSSDKNEAVLIPIN